MKTAAWSSILNLYLSNKSGACLREVKLLDYAFTSEWIFFKLT
jgi:hypothetical protein